MAAHFPFVMLGMGLLGLHDLGDSGMKWLLMDVLWATVSGIVIGVAAGVVLARLGWKLRSKPHKHELMDDFLGLGLIGVVYGLTVLVNGWGFLAVFFSAVALRQTELKLAKASLDAFNGSRTQQSARADGNARPPPDPPQTVSEGSLVFKEHLERLSEVVLVLLIGGTLFINSWTWEASRNGSVFVRCARPVSVIVSLLVTDTKWRMLGMTGWFGVRGIGSLYYLMYAIENGLPEGAIVAIDTNDADRRHTVHCSPWHQRQTVDEKIPAALKLMF